MRKIIHVDMDAFFASIEQRNQPKLRGKPIAVGGDPNKRSVVATASYEARAYGVHSAMPMATAVKRCPDLIIVPPNLSAYRKVSQQIQGIFRQYSDCIEPLSIDESYLDVSHVDDYFGSATLIAKAILKTIYEETQLTASAGVSYCKFLAKYASGVNKPNGVFTITPRDARAIIDALPIGKFHGIGPATEKKLQQLGIKTGFDLRHANLSLLIDTIGKSAHFYYQLAQGQDNRAVRTERIRKSYGNEKTFAKDINNATDIEYQLQSMTQKTWQAINKQSLTPKTLTVKIKYSDFSLHTRSYTETQGIHSLANATQIAHLLLHRQPLIKPIRLIGVSLSNFTHKEKRQQPLQLRLFD